MLSWSLNIKAANEHAGGSAELKIFVFPSTKKNGTHAAIVAFVYILYGEISMGRSTKTDKGLEVVSSESSQNISTLTCQAN